jgi:hypothetical protein
MIGRLSLAQRPPSAALAGDLVRQHRQDDDHAGGDELSE